MCNRQLLIAMQNKTIMPDKSIETPANASAYWISATVFIAVFAVLPVLKYTALHSNFFDLGIFQSALFNVAENGEWQRSFSGHAHPLMPLWAGLYGLFPIFLAPYALLTLQALALAIPVFLFLRYYGPLPALTFALYTLLWINNHFDFHFDHLAVPILFIFYWSIAYRRLWLVIVAGLLLMAVKEPFALQTVACGLYLFWISSKKKSAPWLWAGLLLVVAGFAYFYFATDYLFPYFTTGGERGGLDSSAFSWLGHSLGDMLWTVISQPHVVLWEILSVPKKLTYLLVIFGLLAFIPLLRPAALIPALPLLLIAMLSRLDNYYTYGNHYTAGVIIPVMFAFIQGLPVAERGWLRVIVWLKERRIPPTLRATPVQEDRSKTARWFYLLLIAWLSAGHVLLAPSPLGRLFWSDKVWSYHWRAYVPTERDAMIKAALEQYLPADPVIAVTTQNTLNWGYLAHRQVYLPFPDGVAEPVKVMNWSSRTWAGFWEYVRSGDKPPPVLQDRYADYVTLDLQRPCFLSDRGCEWLYGKCQNQDWERRFLEQVAYTRTRYRTVFEQDGFMILQRRPE